MLVRGGSWCLLVLLAGWPDRAQTTARCVLTGSVVNSATGSGIAHALVSYNGLASGYRFTDDGGSFRADNLPEGFYTLTVSKPGFVAEREMAPFVRPNRPRAMDPEPNKAALSPATERVEVKSDSPPTRIQLVPVASVVGTILDENNEPIEGVSVEGIAAKASLGDSNYVVIQTTRTDDRGHYSLLNLSPGDYVVRLAGEASSTHYFSGGKLNLDNNHLGIQPVYYPNSDSVSSALVLHLAPGERANADFQQSPEAAFDINGRLAGFVPQAWTRLRLYREGDQLPLGVGYVNISTGQFRLVDLPPGRYTLAAVQYQADPAKWLAAEASLSVTAETIRNLVVELKGGVDIPVTVSYEAGALQDGQVMLTLQARHTRENTQRLMLGKPPMPQGQTEPDDAPETLPKPVFTDVIPDKYTLSAMTFGNADYVASVRFGELDVLHGEFTAGGVAGEIHVTINGDSATVEGQVSSQGKPVERAQVVILPASGDRTGLKFGACDEEGRYQIEGVPPGGYRIQAWRQSPTAKQILSGAGETLALQPGEHRTIALEVAPDASGQQ